MAFFFMKRRPINGRVGLQFIKCRKLMKDNSDIPLPLDQLRSRVLVFAIIDEATHEYEEITKGYVELSTDEDGKSHTFHYLQVKDEQTHEVLMRSNLKIENNFGKQKGSIISWTDNEQPQYQQIALSFQKDCECDLFWRTICEKIGKSYLEINGMEKLQAPSINNLSFILEKAKNSIDLMDYNIVHSRTIIDGLRDMFYEMKKVNDEFGMGTIFRILHAILSPSYSSNAIQTLLSRQNFFLILDLQQYRKKIPFRSIYEQKVGQYLNNKFGLPIQVYQKIELSHRAIFYRQNVLQLAEDGQMESLMFVIAKEAQAEIISYLNRTRFLEVLVQLKDYPGEKPIQVNEGTTDQSQLYPTTNINQLTQDKLNFLHEAIIIHNQVTGEQLKQTFKQNLYNSSIFSFLKSQIDLNSLKSVQILITIAQIDKIKFFEDLIENFRLNSTDNLLKSLMKVYLNSKEMRSGVAVLIESLVPLFNVKKELLDFFIGTFVCSVFAVAKDPRAILILSNILLFGLQNSSILFPQLIKFKVCEKLQTQYRTGVLLKSKASQLEFVKFLKHILNEQSNKGQLKNKQIEKNLIDSGVIECSMMIYMKHSLRYNIVSSSMLDNLKIIERMDSLELNGYLVKEYLSGSNNQEAGDYEGLSKILAPIKAKYIESLNKKSQIDSQDQGYFEVQRMVHQEILENEEQDTYLMKDEQESSIIVKATQNKSADSSLPTNNQIPNQPQPLLHNINTIKQDSLSFLKRMMQEIKQDQQEQSMSLQPRKIVKRSQDSKQTAIQLCFELPDMDEIEAQEVKGT